MGGIPMNYFAKFALTKDNPERRCPWPDGWRSGLRVCAWCELASSNSIYRS
jgi:hypothetical protein